MMRATLALVCAAALAAPALAKPIAGQTDDLSIQSMHNFSVCVADETQRGAEELLALDYRSPEYAKKINRLAHGTSSRCAPGSAYRFNGMLFAGGLAERLLIEKRDRTRFSHEVAYDAAKPPVEARNPTELTAICVIRAEPAKTWALFQTEPTSREELIALQAISPALVGCVPQGTKMAMNKPGLRAMLALAAYRLAQPEPIASAAAKPIMGEPGSR